MCVTRTSLGLMINAGMHLASSKWPIFGGLDRDQFRINWEGFVNCQVKAIETYSEAKRRFSDRNRDVLLNI